MRIAQVAPPWVAVPPRGYGGIEWIVSLLADGLVDRGHDVTLYATGDSTTKARLEYAFAEAPGSGAINDGWYDVVHQQRVLADATGFDVVHQHSAYASMVAAMLLDVPVVHTLHNAVTPKLRRIYRGVGDRVRFVAISDAQRRHVPELRHVDVVYNGIDLERYPFRERKEDFLLFLGRTSPDKGPRRAVEAARAAGMPLVMAVKRADPLEVEHWERDVEPVLGDDTTVLGEITAEEKTDLLARARAVLFPIDWEEPFGLVMTEAMACGTPVIATPRGAVPEVMVDGVTGFVVGVEGFGDAAAAALRRVGDIDPRACRERVAERFSKERMVEGYEAVYERALAAD